MRITEDNYIKLMKKGNQDALSYFVQNHGFRIKAIVHSRLKLLPNDQEDCMNEIFYSIWDNIKNFDPKKSSFNTWIAAVGKYVVLNYLRKMKNRLYENNLDDNASDYDCSTLDQIITLENESFDELISCLDDKDKELFRLLYQEEISKEEISKHIGMSMSNVYAHLSRGKRKIKLNMKGDSRYEKYL